MRMRGKKPIFNYSDTWSLDTTLSPIIAEGLKKFLEAIKQDYRAGVPQSILTENNLDSSNEDHLQIGMEIWHSEIEKMIFAFDLKNEPDILDYDFEFSTSSHEMPYNLKCTNESEKDRYQKDLTEYEEKCRVGREAFARFLPDLWW